MPVSNFHIKGRQVIGLKCDTKVPFWISFLQSKVFFSNHQLRKVILLEASIHLKRYTAVPVAQVFDPVSLHSIRPWAFPVWHFSYLLPYFFNFNMHDILYCQVSQFVLHLPQSIWAFSVCHHLVPYITPKASTPLCIWYHTFSLCSFQFVEQSFLVWFK